MLYGIPGAPLQYWQQWRDPFPHQVPAIDEMKVTLHGLLDHSNLLDVIRNFIVFETEQGRTVKKVARYQQFRAANKIVERALDLSKPRNQLRGIIWHTQGSGKSLTMIMAARKLWNHPLLSQPTIIIVVDREQLHDQMIGELLKTSTANVVAAESVRDLQAKLASDHRGIIVTTVHKFAEAGSALSSRSNVIMLVDEAQRSQEGDLGAFMRSALPNASLFGLTGTPIEQDDHNTPKAFGRELDGERFERYLDRYSIEDAIRDGATKPIHYEVRMTDWTVQYADLDTKFEELFKDYPPEARKKLMGEAKLDAILKHPKRVGQIAEDIARHFVEHVRPNAFKAMVVCRDKEACALYKRALDTLLSPEVSQVVISEDPVHDVEAVRAYYLGESDRKKVVEEFKKAAPTDQAERDKPENKFRRVEILIVCDMLLTGFDAPILQAMYLDKGLRDHTLLQAIARVNRPYTELKTAGVILDYFGIFENLNDALNYDKSELGEVAFPFARFREMFRDEMDNHRLLVYGDVDNLPATRGALQRWLVRKSREHLVPWVERLSRERRLPISGVMVKGQETRWASCSPAMRITLNLRLLFVPGDLVGYVLIHELVHTKEMNHGRRYWALLRSHCADAEVQDEKLRDAWRLVPAWLAGDARPTRAGSARAS